MHLSPNQWRPDSAGLAQEDVEQYPHLHKLQLVCRKFAGVFREHHALFGALFLRENLGAQAIPGLLAWLQRHNSDISFLQGLWSGPCGSHIFDWHTKPDKSRPETTYRVGMTNSVNVLLLGSMHFALATHCFEFGQFAEVAEGGALTPQDRLIQHALDKSADYTNTHQCKSEGQCKCKGRRWAATALYESKYSKGD